MIFTTSARLSSHIFKGNIGKLCLFPNKLLGTVAFQSYFQQSLSSQKPRNPALYFILYLWIEPQQKIIIKICISIQIQPFSVSSGGRAAILKGVSRSLELPLQTHCKTCTQLPHYFKPAHKWRTDNDNSQSIKTETN